MGLLLSLIGLTSAGVVVANEDTLVGLGELATLKVALAVGGLALIASLHHLKVRGRKGPSPGNWAVAARSLNKAQLA